MTAAAALPSALGLRAATYATLFGLYASTGLRTNEALRLDCDDVDLVHGVLRINDGKFARTVVTTFQTCYQTKTMIPTDRRMRPPRNTPLTSAMPNGCSTTC